MQGKKHTLAKLPILSGSPLRPINAEVNPAPDSDTTRFTNNYLNLADKALHASEQEENHQSRQVRSARLRLEPQDGTPAKDYRIQGGEVEVRILATTAHWRRLTSAEIAHHVENNTVIARWLEARLGWRAVLKKCVQASDDEKRAA